MQIEGQGIHEERVAFYGCLTVQLAGVIAEAIDQVVVDGITGRLGAVFICYLKGLVLAEDIVAQGDVGGLAVLDADASPPAAPAVGKEGVIDDLDIVHRVARRISPV